MLRQILCAVAFVLCAPVPAQASDQVSNRASDFAGGRVQLGYGRLMTNDFFGDGEDRWRSGSVSASHVFGQSWYGDLPTQAGELLELRFQGETLSPSNLKRPAAGDRPFAGQVSLGLHTHYQTMGYEVALGGGLTVIGPQTGLDRFQKSLHEALGMAGLSAATRAAQIRNQIHGDVVVEIGREIDLGGTARLRPFVEARAGAETLLRGGFDVTFGSVGLGELLVRDNVTGHRYRTIDQKDPGLSLVMGADFAHVSTSAYLPEARGYTLTDSRNRVRAGLHWQGQKAAVFYGVTWLGKEFVGQAEDQVVGSWRLKIKF